MQGRLDWILRGLGLRELMPLFEREGIDDSLLAGLSEEELRSIGVEKLGDRKRLLKEFAKLGASGFAAQSTLHPQAAPRAAAAAVSSPASTPPSTLYSQQPLLATASRPFLNSLRVPMVPIARGKTLFSVFQVRVRDYMEYVVETGAMLPEVDYEQGLDHPVVNVQWNDAHLFCDWLTAREVWLGLIPESMIYRLPADEEWSAAVGLTYESGTSPKARSGVVEGYPWGGSFPPSATSGNYHPKFGSGFRETSPVGSFAPSRIGIYDLGGNVWEWCMDVYERGSPDRVLRGASCFNDDPLYLMSSFRDHCPPGRGRNNVGIRLALAPASEGNLWLKS